MSKRLNEEEIQEFLKEVKGKKIRWSGWRLEESFLIDKDASDSNFIGDYCAPSTEGGINISKRSFSIMNGFNPDVLGSYWILLEDEIDQKATKLPIPPIDTLPHMIPILNIFLLLSFF